MQDDNVELNSEASGAAAETVDAGGSTKIKELEEKLAAAEQKVLRMHAEMDNMHKRAERSLSDAHKYATSKLLHDLIPVMDSLVQGLAAEHQSASAETLRHGMQLTQEQLSKVLARHGVKEIDPKVGETFDPMKHEAMTMVPNPDATPNTVLQVLQKGYELHDRVIRAARVIVSK